MDNREPTRTRAQGTKVTKALTPAERYAAFCGVVTGCQYAKIDGAMVDLFSAQLVVNIYQALSAEGRAKFISYPAPAMMRLAYALAKRAGQTVS